MTSTLRVDIVSDIVCPWCYIGWHRFQAGVAMLGEPVELDIHWHPFELNPDLPPEGVDRRSYLAAKFGEDQIAAIHERLNGAAAADGLPLRMDRVTRQPSTFQAHRLMVLAEQAGNGAATELALSLFKDFFVEGRDIGQPDVLAAAGAAAGLAPAEVESWLAGDAGAEEVRAREADSQRLGIRGVPFFILDRRLGLSGAQDPTVVAGALREALAPAPGEAQAPA